MTKFQLAASVAALSLSLAAPAFAQSYTLYGTDVPEDQLANIQAHCDALFAAEPVEETATDSNEESSDDSDPGFSDEDSAESETPVDFATLDLTTVDIEACRTGGFIVSAEGGASDATSPDAPQGDDAGSTVNAPSTTK